MKRTPLPIVSTLLGLGLAVLLASSAPGSASAAVDVNVFFGALQPYGTWWTVEPYGRVWAPRVAPDWRPYVNGHWVYTSENGWTWVGAEAWGWAAYHYGRWWYDPTHHWVWIPGAVWGPAWVAWRHGNGVIGWAALPPEAVWEDGVGLIADGAVTSLSPEWWCFVSEPSFLAPSIRTVVIARNRSAPLLRTTGNVTRYTMSGHRVLNDAIDVRHLEQVTGRPVPRFHVAPSHAPVQAAVAGNQVRIYRPGPPAQAGATPSQPINSAHLAQRQKIERQRLEESQAIERRELDARQRRSVQQAPEAQRKADARQARQRQAMEKRHRAQVRDMQQRHAHERAAAGARRGAGSQTIPRP
jgi:hypothetical protein